MATIFTRIAQGEIPSHRIAESADYYAFLDINPMQVGHTLVIPKREVDYFFDLEREEMAGIMEFARVIAIALRSATDCARVAVSVVGLEVPHAHIHLIPINEMGDVHPKHKLQMDAQELATIAERIRSFVPAEYK